MRILVIHQYFLRPGEAGGSRFNELTRMWREAGHEVTVVAGQVAYTTGARAPEYEGHCVVEEEQGGVRVLRAYTPAAYARGFLGRMVAFFAFTFSASWAAATWAARPDVVVATSPPLIAVVPGLLAKWRWGVGLVFEVRDLWPESAVTVGVLREGGLLTRILYSLEAAGYRLADRINVLTPAFRDDIVRRGLAAHEKIAFIPNGADLDLFVSGPPDEELRRRLGWEGKRVALYAGAHGIANHLEQLVDAAEHLRGRDDVLIATAGDGPERARLMALAETRGLTNIQFMGSFPKEQMPALVRSCDLGLAVLKRVDTFKTVYPNKVFDYMACERPVVLAIDGVARRLVVDDAGAGLFAEPEDGAAIASAIARLVDDPALARGLGGAGRRFVVAECSRDALSARYLALLQDLAGR